MNEDSPIELVPEKEEAYPWAADDDERRRCFVFEFMASPDLDIKILLANMDAALQWLKSAKLPIGNKSTPRVALVS